MAAGHGRDRAERATGLLAATNISVSYACIGRRVLSRAL